MRETSEVILAANIILLMLRRDAARRLRAFCAIQYQRITSLKRALRPQSQYPDADAVESLRYRHTMPGREHLPTILLTSDVARNTVKSSIRRFV